MLAFILILGLLLGCSTEIGVVVTYPTFSDSFMLAFDQTMGFEGGYVNNPDDAGGETKYGISKASYPDEDIKNLSLSRAMFLAHRDYWVPLRLDEVSDRRVAQEMFDTSYNMGTLMAAKFAQGSLVLLGSPVIVDGVVGPQTINALNGFKDKTALLKMMNVLQGMYYLLGANSISEIILMIKQRFPYNKKYLQGWMKRISL